MKYCLHVFLYAAALLTIARLGTDALRQNLAGQSQEQYAEMSSDWSEESEETEEDTTFEDDFATGNDEASTAQGHLLKIKTRDGQLFFNGHITEVVPPPPQA